MADNAGEVDGRLQIIGMIFFLIRVINFQTVQYREQVTCTLGFSCPMSEKK